MKKVKAPALRVASILFFVALTVFSLATKSGTGTISAFGYDTISAICPLGSLESMVATRAFVPRILVPLLVLVLIAIVLGRIFCAWVCPAPLFRSWFQGTKNGTKNGQRNTAVSLAGDIGERSEGETGQPSADATQKPIVPPVDHSARFSRVRLDSRHWVLGGALVSSAIFGFPVFCLVCPLGLTFATIIGLWRLFGFNEPTWGLIVFPVVLALELVVFRKWCRKICPLGALISLISALNVFGRPKVDSAKCVRSTKGIDCRVCKNACFEEIDLHDARNSQPLSECTKCRECADACPVSAISFPWKPGASVVEGAPMKFEDKSASLAPETLTSGEDT
ncbi:MAG: 4Fe-4S binding protein [Coriobacteriia bacterium]